MKCPYCSNIDTKVIDSRPAEDGSSIRRRRSCDICGKRFTTYEKVETIPLIIIKKDDNREQYDRAKIEAGILRACYKRPVSAEAIKQAVEDIETEIYKLEEKEIPSNQIGELVMGLHPLLKLQKLCKQEDDCDRRYICFQSKMGKHKNLCPQLLLFPYLL